MEEVDKEQVMLKRTWCIALFSIFIAMLTVEIIFKISETSYLRPILYCLIIVPTTFILIYHLMIREGIASYSDFGLIKEHISKNILTGMVLGVLSGIMAFVLGKYYLGLSTIMESNLILAIIAKGIAAPIWEEFIFRGLIFSSLLWILEWSKDWSQESRILWIGFSYTVVAVIFTLGHYGTSNLLIVYFAGIIDTLAFHLTKSLVAPVLTHSIYNLLQILLPSYVS